MTEPLVAADVDLRDFGFMPLDVRRLLTSETWIEAADKPKVGHAVLCLWAESWHQVPAASLPDNDKVLARLAMCDAKTWKRIRDDVLAGWVKCDDGLLYHPVVAEKALESWDAKKRQRARTEAATAARAAKREAQHPQRDDERNEQRHVQRDVHQGTGTGTVRAKAVQSHAEESRTAREPETPPDPPPAPATPTDAGRACLLMRKAGCPLTNPQHPDLLGALAEGVTPEALGATAAEAIEGGKAKPFAWAIATARSRHREALTQRTSTTTASHGASSHGTHRPSLAERAAAAHRAADERDAAEHG